MSKEASGVFPPGLSTPSAIGGAKTIGLIGGVSLLINNITGSAMVLFPSLYQQAGWFMVTLCLLALVVLSYLCSVMIIESMAAMPGNARFTKRVEYTSLAYYYLGRRGYGIAQFFFQMSLACNNISSIIQSVQVMDFAIAEIFGRSCAIPQFYPTFAFTCPPAVEGAISVFGDAYVLSIGFIVTALVCIPFGFWNLDDNIVVQKVACFLVISMVGVWCGIFFDRGLVTSRMPVFGASYEQVLGVCVFNFAVISSIPSWVNEKKERTSIPKTLLVSMAVSVGLFTLIGIFGGMAYEPWWNTDQSTETLLNKLKSSSSAVAHVTFFLFPVVVNLTSIPVFSIMQRYNLLEAQVCGERMANFLGIVLPWLIVIPFYTGSGFENIVNWAGTLWNSVINFIIPPLIYIMMIRRMDKETGEAAPHPDLLASDEAAAIAPIDSPLTSVSGVLLSKDKQNTESLLGSDTYAAQSGAYNPNEVDVRSEKEEADDARILGYDPYAMAASASSMKLNAGEAEESVAPWRGLPQWLVAHRIPLAKGVAVLLAVLIVVVIIFNIKDCAEGNC